MAPNPLHGNSLLNWLITFHSVYWINSNKNRVCIPLSLRVISSVTFWGPLFASKTAKNLLLKIANNYIVVSYEFKFGLSGMVEVAVALSFMPMGNLQTSRAAAVGIFCIMSSTSYKRIPWFILFFFSRFWPRFMVRTIWTWIICFMVLELYLSEIIL